VLGGVLGDSIKELVQKGDGITLECRWKEPG